MRVYAMVPARSGSKGLPDKNIRPIGGHPLMAYAIAFGRALEIDRVIVSTDSPDYADIAKRYGADCPYLRGTAASSDTAMEEDILKDMEANLPAHGIDMPDVWVRLKPTNPFRSLDSVKRGLSVLRERADVQSVRIVSPSDPRLWTINEQGWLAPMVAWDKGRSVMRRGEFGAAYSPFNLDILRHENYRTLGAAYMGERIYPIVDHKITGIDVNDADDFAIVKSLIESTPRPDILNQYLSTAFLG